MSEIKTPVVPGGEKEKNYEEVFEAFRSFIESKNKKIKVKKLSRAGVLTGGVSWLVEQYASIFWQEKLAEVRRYLHSSTDLVREAFQDIYEIEVEIWDREDIYDEKGELRSLNVTRVLVQLWHLDIQKGTPLTFVVLKNMNPFNGFVSNQTISDLVELAKLSSEFSQVDFVWFSNPEEIYLKEGREQQFLDAGFLKMNLDPRFFRDDFNKPLTLYFKKLRQKNPKLSQTAIGDTSRLLTSAIAALLEE